MLDTCEKCGTPCMMWSQEALQVERDHKVPPGHCFVVAILSHINAYRAHVGPESAIELSAEIIRSLIAGLEMLNTNPGEEEGIIN